MKGRSKWAIAGMVVLVELIAVIALARPMYPVKNGTSAEFWQAACGVHLRGESDVWAGIYPPRDGWYIYYVQGFHGQFLYRVPRSEAVADYRTVLNKVAEFADNADAKGRARWAYAAFAGHHSEVEHDPERFLALIREEMLRSIRVKDEEVYYSMVSGEKEFDNRWAHVQRYWMNMAFEIVFFGALTIFALWPWLRRKPVSIWCLHMGALPVLLFLPSFLGYCSFSFTSAGPSGGVLYPWVIVWFRSTPLWLPPDEYILRVLSGLLTPLSQPLGPMLSLSGGFPFGPLTTLLAGAVVAAGTWAVFAAKSRRE